MSKTSIVFEDADGGFTIKLVMSYDGHNQLSKAEDMAARCYALIAKIHAFAETASTPTSTNKGPSHDHTE